MPVGNLRSGFTLSPEKKKKALQLKSYQALRKTIALKFPKVFTVSDDRWSRDKLKKSEVLHHTELVLLSVPLPQEVWKATKKVGVAIATKKDGVFTNTYIVARYYPPGNILGSFGSNVE